MIKSLASALEVNPLVPEVKFLARASVVKSLASGSEVNLLTSALASEVKPLSLASEA